MGHVCKDLEIGDCVVQLKRENTSAKVHRFRSRLRALNSKRKRSRRTSPDGRFHCAARMRQQESSARRTVPDDEPRLKRLDSARRGQRRKLQFKHAVQRILRIERGLSLFPSIASFF